jgi:hypothetical protein
MLSSSVVLGATALLAPLAAASSGLVCTPSVNGYGINSARNNALDFCSTAERSNTTLLEKSYGLPYLTLRFSGQKQLNQCSPTDCVDAYTKLFTTCEYCQPASELMDDGGEFPANRLTIGQYNNNTIWGTSQVETSCATYNYTIGNSTSPFLTPNTTLAPGAAITPSPTGDANGNTAVLSTTSGAQLAQVSGSVMLGVAGIFFFFL